MQTSQPASLINGQMQIYNSNRGKRDERKVVRKKKLNIFNSQSARSIDIIEGSVCVHQIEEVKEWCENGVVDEHKLM